MEALIVLVLLIPVAAVIALITAIVASRKASSAAENAEELKRRLTRVEAEIVLLRRELSNAKRNDLASASAAPTTAQTQAPLRTWEPVSPSKTEAFLEKISSPPVPQPAPPPETKPGIQLDPEPVIAPPPVIPPTSEPPPIPVQPPPFPGSRPVLKPEPFVPPLVFAEKIESESDTATPPAVAAPPPVVEKASLEMRLGTYWLVRVGIVMLLTGLAFFSNYAYHNIITKLGPGGKISLMYLASGLLLGAGAWWQRRNVKESLKNYAQVLFAGGLAAVYFTTYAAYHIPPLRVIGSAVMDGTLLLVWAGVIAWIADRKKSEVMALFAVGLAFYSSVITRVGEFTLYSNLILTIAAVVFLVRNRWAGLSFASLGTTYAGYVFWRFLHLDGWHWAHVNDNLTLGAGFLACYWLVFTVATFLSKAKNLSGPNRAAFLTLNNGLFFALFLLTMFQVRNGHYWEFSLSYGLVLTALAGVAKKFLPDEPFAKNSYLTQGLLLITLGFITKFAGLHLSLVLGVESVVLYMLANQRKSVIFKSFAYAMAALACGWCMCSLKPFVEEGLWTGAALGLLMAVNAVRAHRLEIAKGIESQRLETTVFTLFAFAVWTVTVWFNTDDPHLPVVLVAGIESLVLFNWVACRQSQTPRIFAHLAATLAVIFFTVNLKWFDAQELYTGIALGLMMVLNAYEAQLEDAGKDAAPLRWEAGIFSLLALAGWFAATWFNTSDEHRPLVLAIEAVALTASVYVLRVREVALLGQLFLVVALGEWLFYFQNHTPPWWNPLALILITLGLGHWWQKQKMLILSGKFSLSCQTIFALALVGVVLLWLHPLVNAPTWLVLTSALAVGATVYGVVTRAWPLAIFGQIFLAVSGVEFYRQVMTDKPMLFFPLAPIAVLMLLSVSTVTWFSYRKNTSARVRDSLLSIALVYRWIALTMSLFWLWQYVPDRQHVVAFMGAGAALFAYGVWKRKREALYAAAVYVIISMITLWATEGLVMDVYWANLLSLLVVLVMQQVLRRWSAPWLIDESIHGVIVLGTGLSLWRFVSCWAMMYASGLSTTMVWAAFAVVIFGAGMILRERFHRWFGLGVLAASVGRVVLVDVWKQETIYRVLTFMALGVALLVVGFVYNKFQEKIREWL